MEWTEETPTEPGTYWLEDDEFKAMVDIVSRGGELYMRFPATGEFHISLYEGHARWCRVPEPEESGKT